MSSCQDHMQTLNPFKRNLKHFAYDLSLSREQSTEQKKKKLFQICTIETESTHLW
jgi:hypothetical protein